LLFEQQLFILKGRRSMALIRVNPTRMEYNKIRDRLRSSQRGYKMLKSKRDDLVKQFVVLAKKNREMREIIEKKMAAVYENFMIAEALMGSAALEDALMLPGHSASLEADTQNLMGVDIPVYKFNTKGDIYPYGLYSTSGELDIAVEELSELIPQLLELSQIEKSLQLLTREIEKTRRTVNALEYVRIPNLQQTVKYIRMKLEGNEQSNTTRLMKVKDMMMRDK